ncbi:MAG: efflux RND transporter periplasmic adaptor subunit [Acidobacteriota bacterium]
MKKWRFVIILTVLAAAAILAVVFGPRSGLNGDQNGIVFTGNIELLQTDVAFKFPGRMVELLVDEGDSVQKSQLVARLDDRQLQDQKREAEAQLRGNASRKKELQTLIAFQKQSLEAQIEQRQAEIGQAQATLDRLLEGSRPQEIQEAQAAVAIAEASFDRAQKDWQRAQDLFATEDISRAQHDQSRSAYETAQGAAKQARERYNLVVEGPRRQDIQVARENLSRAKAALKQTESTHLEIERNQQALKTLETEAEALRARIAQIETQIDDTSALAPFDGVVLVKSAEEDEVVAAGSSVVTLGDLAHPWVRGYIPETQLGRVKLGMPVRVTTDSYPNKAYDGRVSFIASEAEFTPKQIETQQERVKLVYRIKVDIANPEQELKLNMPVNAELLLDGKGGR